ncbi:hypothetical protein AaE_015672 [Aphanomyces astaci]|uniref:Uncharacterized protein n=1 Tax=Aphanomyces astaci TaxID=112090 RepID=A0A6A4YV95_APHAT|nr:hypothetical protein AaE_015672 [Aphanomyces astaci]
MRGSTHEQQEFRKALNQLQQSHETMNPTQFGVHAIRSSMEEAQGAIVTQRALLMDIENLALLTQIVFSYERIMIMKDG